MFDFCNVHCPTRVCNESESWSESWSESCVSYAEKSMIVKSFPVCVIKLPTLPFLTNFAVHAYYVGFCFFTDEILLKDKSWRGRGFPTLPSVQFSLLKKTNSRYMPYKRKSCSSVSQSTGTLGYIQIILLSIKCILPHS
jgi:hypothetical protein